MTEERTGSSPSEEQPESPEVQPGSGAATAPSAPPEPEASPEPAGAVEPAAAAEPTEPGESAGPGEPGAAAAEPVAVQAAPAARLPRWRVLAIAAGSVAGVAILAVVAVLVIGGLTGDDLPEAGDCLSNSDDPDEIAIVECDSETAFWRVVGFDGTWSERAFEGAEQGQICQAFPGVQDALWYGVETDDGRGEGEVACLAPIRPEP